MTKNQAKAKQHREAELQIKMSKNHVCLCQDYMNYSNKK